jgi:phage terminase small subunit
MKALTTLNLTEQQRELVRLVVEGRRPEEAAELAGYNPKSVYRTLRSPAVAAAINEMIQLDLAAIGAPMAYRVAKSLLKDETVSARVRADLSIKILDRAGHIAPTRKETAPPRALSEMSRDELVAFIEHNQAEIERVEGELASRAKDVSFLD